MVSKVKSYFKRAYIALVEARQQQVNRMIAERGYWKHIQ